MTLCFLCLVLLDFEFFSETTHKIFLFPPVETDLFLAGLCFAAIHTLQLLHLRLF